MRKNTRNLRLMYAISLMQGMVFYAPIASLYRQAAGLNLAQIALIEGISYIFALGMELPWGVVADRIGYRRTMVLSCGIYFVSKLIFWRAEGFGAFLLERFAISMAIAGLSGVDQSILALSCGEADGHRAFGYYDAFSAAGLLIAAGVYAGFVGSDYRLAALLTVVSYGAMFLLSLGIEDVRPSGDRPAFSAKGFWAFLRGIVRRRRFLLFLLGFALYREAVQVATVWLNQNQYLRCGMDEGGIGVAYIALTLLTLSGALSKRLTDALGERRFAGASFFAAALCCAGMCVLRSGWLSVAGMCVIAVSGAMLRPLAASICNRQISGADRATQLSTFALIQDCAAAGANAACGRAADWRLNAGFALCMAACAIGWWTYHQFAEE